MADCSDILELQMSGGLTLATRRQKRFSNFTASPLNSGKSEVRIRCRTPTTIYLSGTSEAGRSIVAPSERTQAVSTAGSTALLSAEAANYEPKYRCDNANLEITAISERVRLSDRPRSGSPYKYFVLPASGSEWLLREVSFVQHSGRC